MPVNLEPCGYCDAINQRGADRCHKCGRLLALLHELEARRATAGAVAVASVSDDAAVDLRTPVREPQPDSYDAPIDERGADLSGGTERTVKTDEAFAARPDSPVPPDFVAPAIRSVSEPSREVVAKRRSPGMRAAAFGVTVVALAVPGYLAYQDEAPFREGLDAITPRLDASSAAVQPTEPPQAIPVADPTAQPRGTAPVLPMPQDADATREPRSQPTHTANETPSPPPKAESNSKTPQAGKNVQPRVGSSTSGSKQGSSSRKNVKSKPADTRTRAKSSEARPAESTGKAASYEITR